MKFITCWLISVSDILGFFSIYYIILALGVQPTDDLGAYAAYLPNDFHYAVAGCIAAIIPAIVTATYGTLNFELTLSWAIIRWMSPLNVFTNRITYFFKSLFLCGAVWAALITFCLFKCFPNHNFSWVLDMLKNFAHLFV